MRKDVVARAAVAALSIAVGSPLYARADDVATGSVIVAKASGDAVVIWDASPVVAAMLEKKIPDDRMSSDLEVEAAKILVARAGDLANAHTVRVKVIYERTGAVSPVYKTATLTGLERLLSVTASRADAVEHAAAWSAALKKGTLPAGITAEVTGKYPH